MWSAVIALGIAGAASADDGDEAKTTPRQWTRAEIEALQDLANRVLKLETLQQDAELEKQFAENKPTWDSSKMLSFPTPDGNFTAKGFNGALKRYENEVYIRWQIEF